MDGQACVFYGAAQFSKDVDLALVTLLMRLAAEGARTLDQREAEA